MAAKDEAAALFSRHWDETEVMYRNVPMNADWGQFSSLEEHGWGRYFTARRNGVLVGHLYFIVHKSRHTQAKTAGEDFYYFLPEHRRGSDAIRLLRYAVESLRNEGCKQIIISSKITSNRSIDPILRRVGFRHIGNLFAL